MQNEGYFYSKISVAYECLQKYKYRYVDKVETPHDLIGDLLFGTAMHAAMHAAFSGQDPQRVFYIFWNSLLEKDVKWGRFRHEDLRLKGQSIIKKFMRMHYKHYEPKHTEVRLFTEHAGIKYEGTPDFIGKYKGVDSIIDFKTSGYAYKKSHILVNEQMYLYAWLAKQQLGFNAKQLVYTVFVKSDERIQTLKIDLTDSKLDSMVNNIHEVCSKLEKETVYTKNRLSCVKGEYICPFFNRCYGEVG